MNITGNGSGHGFLGGDPLEEVEDVIEMSKTMLKICHNRSRPIIHLLTPNGIHLLVLCLNTCAMSANIRRFCQSLWTGWRNIQ